MSRPEVSQPKLTLLAEQNVAKRNMLPDPLSSMVIFLLQMKSIGSVHIRCPQIALPAMSLDASVLNFTPPTESVKTNYMHMHMGTPRL